MQHTVVQNSPSGAACPECGAPLAPGGSCWDTFALLLALEAEIPGAAGSTLHFYAVACYNLQHPVTMRLTQEALHGLAQHLADELAGRATLAEIRVRTRRRVNGATRVLRREGDPPPTWVHTTWPMHVADVYAGGVEHYPERVTAWARSVCAALIAYGG